MVGVTVITAIAIIGIAIIGVAILGLAVAIIKIAIIGDRPLLWRRKDSKPMPIWGNRLLA